MIEMLAGATIGKQYACRGMGCRGVGSSEAKNNVPLGSLRLPSVSLGFIASTRQIRAGVARRMGRDEPLGSDAMQRRANAFASLFPPVLRGFINTTDWKLKSRPIFSVHASGRASYQYSLPIREK